jgi:SAM-dependent methyltransferase
MCHLSILELFIDTSYEEEFRGKRVLEVGSKYVNGSVRPFIEKYLAPKEYIGVDIESGKYVDHVIEAENIVNFFGEDAFDVVITTEMLEHVQDWRNVIENLKKVVKPQGILYLTTRSKGFILHSYPHDYWRYEVEDIKRIFSDFEINLLMSDPFSPGVFLKAKKPTVFKPIKLEGIDLYSMVLGERTGNIVALEDMPLLRKLGRRVCDGRAINYLPTVLASRIRQKHEM